MRIRIARRFSDAVCVGLLARRGIRVDSSYELPAVDSARRDVFAEENRGGDGTPLEAADRLLRSGALPVAL